MLCKLQISEYTKDHCVKRIWPKSRFPCYSLAGTLPCIFSHNNYHDLKLSHLFTYFLSPSPSTKKYVNFMSKCKGFYLSFSIAISSTPFTLHSFFSKCWVNICWMSEWIKSNVLPTSVTVRMKPLHSCPLSVFSV